MKPFGYDYDHEYWNNSVEITTESDPGRVDECVNFLIVLTLVIEVNDNEFSGRHIAYVATQQGSTEFKPASPASLPGALSARLSTRQTAAVTPTSILVNQHSSLFSPKLYLRINIITSINLACAQQRTSIEAPTGLRHSANLIRTPLRKIVVCDANSDGSDEWADALIEKC
ncbi:hypothetical protein EVAR_45271_1 [Eumeta japonica]|uniref:Uncharacterized protein n=1 Tax=Eumeta variegata TaxID=151549 RepID=A0A4C1XBH7_EUMVA|nr:hypothetical protein EVAR_45271_1 [Eumeta japonica]